MSKSVPRVTVWHHEAQKFLEIKEERVSNDLLKFMNKISIAFPDVP